ncbi:hypothetical protein ACWEHT_20435 [Streptomyces sp. NPDC004646]
MSGTRADPFLETASGLNARSRVQLLSVAQVHRVAVRQAAVKIRVEAAAAQVPVVPAAPMAPVVVPAPLPVVVAALVVASVRRVDPDIADARAIRLKDHENAPRAVAEGDI